jgi:hypothetical protein
MKNLNNKKIQTFVLQFVFSSSFSVSNNLSTALIPPALIGPQNEAMACSEIFGEELFSDLGKYAENKSNYDRFLIISKESELSKYLLKANNLFKNTKDLLGSKKLNSSIYRIDINLNSQGNFLPIVFKGPGFQPSFFKGRVTPSKIFFGKTGYFELSTPF